MHFSFVTFFCFVVIYIVYLCIEHDTHLGKARFRFINSAENSGRIHDIKNDSIGDQFGLLYCIII